tara:strand:- start:6577 stop:6741 length:165 start_codon:yes stop_codon:yes gene_type:complete
MNEMSDKMRVHYLSSNALDEIQSMLKQKDAIIEAQKEHIEVLQDVIVSLGGLIP